MNTCKPQPRGARRGALARALVPPALILVVSSSCECDAQLLRLPGGAIEGRVCDRESAGPLAGARVVLRQGRVTLREATSDDLGRFRFRDVSEGDAEVVVDAPEGQRVYDVEVRARAMTVFEDDACAAPLDDGTCASGDEECASPPASDDPDAPDDPLDPTEPIAADEGALEGTLCDPAGGALVGATVKVVDSAGDGVAGVTDDDGAFHLAHLAAGAGQLYVQREPDVDVAFDVEIEAGAVTRLPGPAACPSAPPEELGPGRIEGSFCSRGTPGTPFVGQISLRDTADDELLRVVSDASGAYAFEDLEPGAYVVVALQLEGHERLPVVVEGGATTFAWSGDCQSSVCPTGAERSCYGGAPATKGVGTCTAGVAECSDAGGWGACVGQRLPGSEICFDGLDNDCDGAIDEGCGCVPGETQACYPGPADTEGVGVCRPGQQVCGADAELGPCEGAILPGSDVPQNGVDEDCNGDDAPCTEVNVDVLLLGDCLTAACPPEAPVPVGCNILMSPGDDRGCVAHQSGSRSVYFQAGDECDAGFVMGTLVCSTQACVASGAMPSSLNASTCFINKPIPFYPATPAGCPATD